MVLGPTVPLGLGFACFGIAWLLYVAHLIRNDPYLGYLGTRVQAAGVIFWLFGWIWRIVASGMWPPAIQMQDAYSLLTLACGAIALWLERRYNTTAGSAFILVIVLGLGGYALFTPMVNVASPLAEPRSLWLLAYVVLSSAGYAVLAVTGAVGAMAVLRLLPTHWGISERLPSEELLSRMSRRNVSWALLVLSLALGVGMGWSWLRDGLDWPWAAGQLWMLAAWSAYGALLHFGAFRWWPIADLFGLILIRFGAATLLK